MNASKFLGIIAVSSLLVGGCDDAAKSAAEKPATKAADGKKDTKDGAVKDASVVGAKDGAGNEVKAGADGALTAKDAQGNEVKAAVDGDGAEIVAKDPNGTVAKIKTGDGSTEVKDDQGNEVKTNKDGTEVKGDKGDEVKTNKDGSTEVKSADGTSVKVGKDGKVKIGGKKIPGL